VVLLVSSLWTSSSAATKVKDEAKEPGKDIITVVADENWRPEASGRREEAGGTRRNAEKNKAPRVG
jgi:hypothetical protein